MVAISEEYEELQELAREKDATLIVGITEGINDDEFLNASVVFTPDGEMVDRYDKVRTVPFGEFVPFRSLIEKVAGSSGIPGRDAVPGTEPADVDTPVGKLGVAVNGEGREDKHLPEIAALIDRRQFELITRPDSGLVVIQGGAGSGKTTIGLHRMAYLAFQQPKRFRPDQMLIDKHNFFNALTNN